MNSMKLLPAFKVSVIVSTYNSPEWLEKVFWGFCAQTEVNFEVVIADDGSREDTRDLINRMRLISPFEIVHVWQADDGFQKCRILNKAIASASGDYLIFTDGDCIPRNDFVAQHIQNADQGRYLSGAYLKLPMKISQAINREDVESQRVFSPEWLMGIGFNSRLKLLKLTRSRKLGELLNRLIPVKPTWNGNNSSCFKVSAIAVNGFNELMQYGGEDCEFGYRLVNLGLKPKRIRYSTIALHLDHSRGYVTQDMLHKNSEIIKITLEQKLKWTNVGVNQYA
jgi:glycosyltransferase involved in cell wall biosynthesis